MNIDKFMVNYNGAKNKDEYIKSICIDKYVPYEKKITICSNILNSSNYTSVGGNDIYKQNTPMQHMLFTLSVINEYTEIEIDFNQSLDCFNRLCKSHLIEELLKNISEYEYKEFLVIFDMCKNDAYENTRSVISYFDSKIESLIMSSDMIIDSLNKAIENK